MTVYATSSDVSAVWRPFTDAEAAIVDAVIAEASDKLLAKVPAIDTLIDGNSHKTALAKHAVVNAVRRRFMNPEGVLEFSIDDYKARRDSTTSTGKVYIDKEDLVGLKAVRRKFGTIRLRAGM